MGKRHLIPNTLTELIRTKAFTLVPTGPSDHRFVDIVVDGEGKIYNLRFLGEEIGNPEEWKPYLIPLLSEFSFTENRLYQLDVNQTLCMCVELPEDQYVQGTVIESSSTWSRVKTASVELAVPGCLTMDAPCTLVRTEFFEVYFPQDSGYSQGQSSGVADMTYSPAAQTDAYMSMSTTGVDYSQSQTTAASDLARAQTMQYSGFTAPDGQVMSTYAPSNPPSDQAMPANTPTSDPTLAMSTYQPPPPSSDPAFSNPSPYTNIDPTTCDPRVFDYHVDISSIDVEEYPTTCGEQRLPIYSLSNTGKWNADLQQSVLKLGAKFSHWRRSRGDGNCYFRAVAVAYLEHLCRLSTPPYEMRGFYMGLFTQTNIKIARVLAPHVKYFIRKLAELYEAKKTGNALRTLQGFFQSPAFDQAAVATFRCIARDSILKLQQHPDFCAFFTVSSGVQGLLNQVEAMGTEAEGLTFKAMACALNAKIIHWTVKGAECRSDEFEPETSGRILVIHLLLKPGHYDVLYPLGIQLLDHYSFEQGMIMGEDPRWMRSVQDLFIEK